MAIDAIIGAVGAIGDAIAGAVAPAAAAAEVAAPEVAAGAEAAGVGAAAAGATALPEIVVTPEIAGGAAALGGGALTGGALTGAEAAGAGLFGGGPLAESAAALEGGAVAGAAPIATEGISAVAPAVAGGLTTATEALGGATGPLAALTAEPTFEQTFASEIAGLGGGVSGPSDISAFAPTEGTPASTNLPDVFANAPTAVPGEVPFSTALSLEEPATDINLPGTGTLTPGAMTPTGQTIAPPNIPATATPSDADIGAIQSSTGALPAGSSLTAGTAAAGGGLNKALQTAGLFAPLGAIGLTLARGQPSLPPALQQAISGNQPAAAVASSQLRMAANNQITPAQQAAIDQYKTNAKNQLYQQIASSGRDPASDSSYIQGSQQIEANGLILQQQYVDAEVKNGLAAQGLVDQTLIAAADVQIASDQAFQQSLASATQSFGLVAAISSLGKTA